MPSSPPTAPGVAALIEALVDAARSEGSTPEARRDARRWFEIVRLALLRAVGAARATRPDGWPLCVICGEDEAYSLATPADASKIDGCYECGRYGGYVQPMLDRLAALTPSAAPPEGPRKPVAEAEAQRLADVLAAKRERGECAEPGCDEAAILDEHCGRHHGGIR